MPKPVLLHISDKNNSVYGPYFTQKTIIYQFNRTCEVITLKTQGCAKHCILSFANADSLPETPKVMVTYPLNQLELLTIVCCSANHESNGSTLSHYTSPH